ncbi:hypothetical protein [Glutamicibacter sp. V16R2B1]|uniref:hypothetical protein n=1 Tax=Glutamicibacter sp. V16R2B1 TaxID=2036207 RepID=UPI0010FE107D|nr:hypothetical protein [Glutamicibacter sp. V16R2B1]MCK9901217.1 hypothetical protein [Frankia sp. Cpl3]TLK48010.1 hypothetical protein FDN03_15455 [Glutamicibacter sp. V16R2B1]
MADNRVFPALANAKAAIDALKETSHDPRVSRAEQLAAAIAAEACERQLNQLSKDVRSGLQTPP